MKRIALTAALILFVLTPATADPTPILLVSGEKKTRFGKLTDALAAAKPGDRVVVESGEHRGAFVLPAGVTLSGKGTLVAAGSRPALVSAGKESAVEDLSFRGPPTALLIDVTGGSVGVSGCQFTGGGGGIRVGENAKASIVKCLFLDLAGVGIHLIGTDSTVKYCRIRGSGWHGLRIDRSRSRVSRTVIEASARGGIYVAGEDESTVEHCHLARNVSGGISVYGRAHTRVVENSFVGHLRTGLSIDIGSSVKARGNVFVDNGVGISRFETAHGPHFLPDTYRIGRPDVADNAFCGNRRDYSNFATDPVGYRADREFRGPPAGDYRPAAGSRLLREGFPYPEAGLSDAFRTPPAPPPEPRTESSGSLLGRVLDEEGEPLSDAWVTLGNRNSQRVAWTGPNGRFRLDAVPEGNWRPVASARGHLAGAWPDPVSIGPGETAELPDLRLARDHPIRGFLGDGRGGPAPGAIVWAVDPGDRSPMTARRGIAGWNGKFSVEFVPPGRRVLFAFRRQETDRDLCVVHARPEVDAGTTGVRLVHGVERVVVRITDAVTGSADELELAVWGKPAVGGELLLTRWERALDLTNFDWPVDFTGREVTLPLLLPPGRYDFVVRRSQHGRVVRVASAAGVVVRAKESRGVPLTTRRAGRIEGRVVDEEGEPVSGALIESAEVGPAPDLCRVLERDPPGLYRAISDEHGAFRIGVVEPGDRRFRVTRTGFRERVVTVPGVKPRQTSPIRIQLTR